MPPAIPESTKNSLGQRLRARQRERRPSLAGVNVRFGGRFADIDGELEHRELLPLCDGVPLSTIGRGEPRNWALCPFC
jgi:hypothetical protein